jgi:hypothetical protein
LNRQERQGAKEGKELRLDCLERLGVLGGLLTFFKDLKKSEKSAPSTRPDCASSTVALAGLIRHQSTGARVGRNCFMIAPDTMTIEECRTAILQLADRGPHPESIRRLLHISRLKLGAAIERIESGDLANTILDEILRHTECVAFEIDTLLSAFQRETPE